MIYNNVTDTLRKWCKEYGRKALSMYDFQGGPSSLLYRVPYDLAFWLGTLTDRDFTDFTSYCQAVRDLLPVPVTPPLGHEPTMIEQYYIQKTEGAFLEEFSHLAPDCPSPGIPYFRVLTEAEAFFVKGKLAEFWDCRENQYWYPLSAVTVPSDQLFYLPASSLEGRLVELGALLHLPEKHAFCLGESWFTLPNCVETGELSDYAGSECFYAAKDFRWLIYFSHEETVSFAGSIVPMIKERFEEASK